MLKKLTNRTWFMPHGREGDKPALGLVRGDWASLVVDSGNSPDHGRKLLEAAAAEGGSPVKYLAITHAHWDHVFGIEAMGLTTITNCITKEHLDGMRKLQWDDGALEKRCSDGVISEEEVEDIKMAVPKRSELRIGTPEIIFQNGLCLDLGGISCVIERIGGSHTEDSTLVFVPEEKVLFMGDCIYGRRYNGVYGYKKETLFPMLDAIKKYEADWFLISHTEPKSREELYQLLDQLKGIGELVGEETDSEAAKCSFRHLYKREVTEEEAFYISCFADVNGAKK